MKQTFILIMLVCILLTSCTSAPPTTKPEQFTVQFTAASVPWLAGLYRCAGGNVVTAEQRGADFLDPQSASMVIRIGRPDILTAYAYQIATDDLLVITNLKNQTSQLTTGQVYSLFTGQIQNWKIINGSDTAVQVWVFPAGEDLQEIFEQVVLDGSPVSSMAHLANSPDEMVQAVQKDANAIGIIPRHWKTGIVASVYTAASNVPVLAITHSKPQGILSQILACLQK